MASCSLHQAAGGSGATKLRAAHRATLALRAPPCPVRRYETKPRLPAKRGDTVAARCDSSSFSQELSRECEARREAAMGSSRRLGKVYLVGTGPGDPELLTLKAYRLMQTVDVVLYDRLVSDDIIDMIHPGAVMVYVGKEAGFHTRSQEEIHALMLQYAGEGQSVLRLKGGDPFIFGRGGEEQQYLAGHGVETEVVPGITAAAGICAGLGIPLTHRGVATGVRYMTGHTREGAEEELRNSLADCRDPMTTMVFYMGLQSLPVLRERLVAAGVDPDLPAVAVERGTTPQQREVWAPLSRFAEEVEDRGLKSPTLIIMGHVVALGRGWQLSSGELKAAPASREQQAAKGEDRELLRK